MFIKTIASVRNLQLSMLSEQLWLSIGNIRKSIGHEALTDILQKKLDIYSRKMSKKASFIDWCFINIRA